VLHYSYPALVTVTVSAMALGRERPDVRCLLALGVALVGVAWGHVLAGHRCLPYGHLCSSRLSGRRSGCPRCGVSGGARGQIDDVLDARDALTVQGGGVDLVQRSGHFAGQLLL